MIKWKIINDCPGYMVGYRAIVDEEGYFIVAPSPMGADYARLIASAPDMMAVLFLLVHGDGQPDQMPCIMAAARAALAKARGE